MGTTMMMMKRLMTIGMAMMWLGMSVPATSAQDRKSGDVNASQETAALAAQPANDNEGEQPDDAPPADTAEPEVAEPVDRIPSFDDSEDAISEGKDIFESSKLAYRALTAVRDVSLVRTITTFNGQTDEQSFEVPMLLTPESMTITLQEVEFTILDGSVYGENEGVENRLYVYDFDGPITAQLFIDIMFMFPFVPVPMMYADDPLNMLFAFNIDPWVDGYRRIYIADEDAEYDEILIGSTGDGAVLELRFDPETKLVRRFRTMLRDPNFDEAGGTEIIVEFHPEVLEQVPLDEFIVNIEDRRQVDSVGALYMEPNAMDLINRLAPSFTFSTLDDEVITSELLAGNAVVLGFWQMQHEGLLPILPALSQLADWEEETGKPVKVLAVNVADELDALRTYWNESEFNVTLALDPDAVAAQQDFKLPAFPTVIVIGPDGSVHVVYPDFEFEADIFKMLQDDVLAALSKGI